MYDFRSDEEEEESDSQQPKPSTSESVDALSAQSSVEKPVSKHLDDSEQDSKPVSKDVKHSDNSDQTSYEAEAVFSESINNENQSKFKFHKQSKSQFPPGVSEYILQQNVAVDSLGSVSELSQSELASGVTSDTSEMSEKRRFVSRSEDVHRISDSDQSISSSVTSDSSRKRRKDKSSLRKSKLNESSDGELLYVLVDCRFIEVWSFVLLKEAYLGSKCSNNKSHLLLSFL